jgi:hypothetical protein
MDSASLGMANLRATAEARPMPSPEFFDIGHDDGHMGEDETKVDQGLEYAKSRIQARKEKMK